MHRHILSVLNKRNSPSCCCAEWRFLVFVQRVLLRHWKYHTRRGTTTGSPGKNLRNVARSAALGSCHCSAMRVATTKTFTMQLKCQPAAGRRRWTLCCSLCCSRQCSQVCRSQALSGSKEPRDCSHVMLFSRADRESAPRMA